MSALLNCRQEIMLHPDCARVILRSFIPSETYLITGIIGRALALDEEEVVRQLDAIRAEFSNRHFDIESILYAHYEKVQQHVSSTSPLSPERQWLIGALFSGEYALESAALFNPSIVPHPDQSNVPAGGLRFIMSLRATGEGHISSIEFREGLIAPDGHITIEPVSRFVTPPEILPNPSYEKNSFIIKLKEMEFDDQHVCALLGPLGEHFTRNDLTHQLEVARHENQQDPAPLESTIEHIQWLADSNYELLFSDQLDLSERIIFPVSPNESNGIEDARFVRFIDDDGSVMYYATYTAYNGHEILPQLIETQDFLHFRIRTLNGGDRKSVV